MFLKELDATDCDAVFPVLRDIRDDFRRGLGKERYQDIVAFHYNGDTKRARYSDQMLYRHRLQTWERLNKELRLHRRIWRRLEDWAENG
jgi:hypothetical protein